MFPHAASEGSLAVEHLTGIASLDEAIPGDLSFLGNLKYRQKVRSSRASLLLLPENFEGNPQKEQMFLRLKDPSNALSEICKLVESNFLSKTEPGVHPTAFLEDSAGIDEEVSIGAFTYVGRNARIGFGSQISSHCHIGDDVEIGRQCRIHPGVKILTRCQVGNEVVLNAGVVLGSEGYGFEQVEGSNLKIPHLGKVVIEDKVEIGANTCIDRARFDESRISSGTKIDNLVQIGHNVKIGKDCLIVAQVGIAGSVKMEDKVVVGGQAGFAGHLTVGRGARIAGQAGITKDVEAGAFLKGNPALPIQLSQRISILQRKLPELFNRFDQTQTKK